MTSELRSWFLRSVFEATERLLGATAVTSLRARLPPRLSPHASLDRLRASAALDSVPLDEAEELLLAVDSVLGDGSGKLLESIGSDLAARVLSQGGGVARAGDLYGTVARLQAFLQHPFVGVPLLFELRRNSAGFALTIGVSGYSRATRALRHLTHGAIVAAERFAREAGAENLKIYAETIGDRSNLSARYLVHDEPVAEEVAPPSRRPPALRVPATSLSQEVERILGTSSSQHRTSSPPPRASDPVQLSARGPESSRLRASLAPPRAPSLSQTELDNTLPESGRVQRAPGALSRSRLPLIKKTGGTDLG